MCVKREKEQNKETKSQFYEINNRLTVCFFNKKNDNLHFDKGFELDNNVYSVCRALTLEKNLIFPHGSKIFDWA